VQPNECNVEFTTLSAFNLAPICRKHSILSVLLSERNSLIMYGSISFINLMISDVVEEVVELSVEVGVKCALS